MTEDPWNAKWDGPKDLLLPLSQGKLEQTCPQCGRREPAGGPCTGCGITPGWRHWRPNYRSEAQRQNAAERGKSLGQNRSQGMSDE